MSLVTSIFVLVGSILALLAAVGLVRFSSPYARYHSAGKASPIAFLFVAIGAGIEVGPSGAAQLAIAAAALLLTLPAATHLLFRSTHRTSASPHLREDALTGAERFATRRATDVVPPGPTPAPDEEDPT